MKPHISKCGREIYAEGSGHALKKGATKTRIRYLHSPAVKYPPYTLPVLLSTGHDGSYVNNIHKILENYLQTIM